jgi:hypothetical protein
MKHWFETALVSSPIIRVELGDAKWFQQRFEFEKRRVFVV